MNDRTPPEPSAGPPPAANAAGAAPRLLAIETSPRVGSVALSTADGTIRSAELTAERGQARDLAGAIERLCAEAGVAMRQLDAIAVGLGPGGYTGMRLAVATARTLGYVLGRPVLGVASSLAAAHGAAVPAGDIVFALDARKGFVYFARYARSTDGEVREVVAPTCVGAARIAAELPAAPFVIGDGLPALAAAAQRELPGVAEAFPVADDVLRVARARFSRGERDEERTLQPLYLRPSEAELLWRRREGGAVAGDA